VLCVCVYPWVHTYMGGVCGGGVCVPLGTYTGARDFKIGWRSSPLVPMDGMMTRTALCDDAEEDDEEDNRRRRRRID